MREMSSGEPRRRSSPSFIIAIVLLVASVGGYAAWRIWRPNDVARSDQLVREFVQDAAREVKQFGRSARRLAAEATGGADASAVAKQIDASAEQTAKRLDDLSDEARDRIDALEGISLKTQRNRVGRVRMRLEEAKGMVTEVAAEVKDELAQSTAPLR